MDRDKTSETPAAAAWNGFTESDGAMSNHSVSAPNRLKIVHEYTFDKNVKIRPQYHLRNSERGLLAWDVALLIKKAVRLDPIEIQLSDIAELDEQHWFNFEGDLPTCRKIAEHARLIGEADLTYPIIVDNEYRVMDGMHRVCKALNLGERTISAYRFPKLPEPDYIGVPPSELPYDH